MLLWFSFPTLSYFDERAHRKEQVYGVVVGDGAIAFTRGYIEEQGGFVFIFHGQGYLYGNRTPICKFNGITGKI